MSDTLILKFGGASVAKPEHFSLIADIILARKQEFPKIVVVVSAMGNTTDQLIELAKAVNPTPPPREFDMLMTAGERISMALLAMALAAKNQEALSFTGSQSGIITCQKHNEARIIEVRPHRLLPHLEKGKIVIVAGFQGVSREGEITTLGRGGSDTTAVALGVKLKAERAEFYKNVPGIFDKDPLRYSCALHLPRLTYDQAMTIVTNGAKVLHSRCLELAKNNALPLHVLSFTEFAKNTIHGTVIKDENILRPELLQFEAV
jgi:aspartate kinase